MKNDDTTYPSFRQRWAWLPVPLFIAALIILRIANLENVYESLYVLVTLNLVFLTLVSVCIAILCARSFSVSGEPGLLMLGCGVLVWGLSSGVASFFIDHGGNVSITIHNLGGCVSAIFHIAGTLLARKPGRRVQVPGTWLWIAYTGILGIVAVITLATLTGWTPLFFVQGEGGTPVRLFILTLTVALFFLTSALLWINSRDYSSPFNYYYALGLALVAIGLAGIMFQTLHGNLLSWAGRAAQYLGGVYMIVAAASSVRDKSIWGISLGNALLETRRQNDFLAEVLENASQPFAVGYPDGRLGMINQAFCSLTGYTAEELRELDWATTLTPAEWRDLERQKLDELRLTGQPVRYEKEYIRHDGSRVPIELLVHLKRDKDSNPEYYYTFITDITYRKKAEAALKISEERYRLLIESSNDWTWTIDADDRYTFASQQVYDILGYRPEKIIGTTPFDLMPPEEAIKIRESFNAAKQQLLPIRNLVNINLHHDGRLIYLESNAKPIFDQEGTFCGYSGMDRDVTERIAAEEALRISEEFFSTVFRASPVAISISQLSNGRFTDVNNAFLDIFGYSRDEIIDRTSMELGLWVNPGERELVISALQSSGSLPAHETRFRRKSGEFGYAQLAAELIDVAGQKLVLGLLIDTTERKKSEDILRRYELLADNSRDIILFLRCDDGCILEANSAATKAYGYHHEELLSLTIHDLRAADTQELTSAQMTEADYQGIIFETVHKRKDGNTFPVEVSSQGTTIGGTRTLISIIRDISERKQAESEIKHLASFPQMNPNPVLEVNDQGEIIICNKAALNYAEAAGHADATPFIPAGLAEIFAAWDRKTSICTYREVRLADAFFAETLLLAPMFQSARIYATDITNIKQAELALHHSNARLNLLADSARDLLQSSSPHKVVESLCRRVMDFLDCQIAFNFLVDEQAGRLRLNACIGIPEEEQAGILWLDYGEAICGCVARDGCRIVVNDIQNSEDPHSEYARSNGIQAYASHPLMIQEKIIGTLSFGTRTKQRFSEDELSLMKAMADQVAIAIEHQQFREMLQKSRIDMLTILDNLPFLAWLKDTEGHYVMVNKPFASICGLGSPKDVIGKTDFDVWPQHLAELYRDDDRKIMESKQRFAFEGLVAAQGEEKWYETFKAPRFDQSGNVIGTTGIARDISERKQAADALKKAHDELEHRVKERTEDLAVTIQALQEEIMERARAEEDLKQLNRLYAVMSEIDQVIVRAESENSLFHDFCRIAVEHGGFLLCWVGLLDKQGQMQMVAASGAIDFIDDIRIFTDESPDYLGPTSIAIREGSYFICNDFLSDPCISHWHEHGKNYGIYAAASVALKNDSRVIGALTLYAGEENLFDRQHEELIMQMGADISFALDNLNREAMRREIMKALREETLSRLQTLEALQKNEQMLMHQSRLAAMGEMINNIAHQWRQPLNVVGLIFQELQICYEMGKFNQEYLEQRVKQAMSLISHMSMTIDDFRNFFKPDKDKVQFNINQVIGRTVSLIEDNFKSQGITIDLVADADPLIDGYPNEYSQVLLNILMNAKDAFSERDPSLQRIVTITSCVENGKAVVTIADTAGGIPEEFLNKVFEPYFTTKGPDKGTGVGLFMAKTIIEKNLGGRLTVQNVNDGAEFRIEV